MFSTLVQCQHFATKFSYCLQDWRCVKYTKLVALGNKLQCIYLRTSLVWLITIVFELLTNFWTNDIFVRCIPLDNSGLYREIRVEHGAALRPLASLVSKGRPADAKFNRSTSHSHPEDTNNNESRNKLNVFALWAGPNTSLDCRCNSVALYLVSLHHVSYPHRLLLPRYFYFK